VISSPQRLLPTHTDTVHSVGLLWTGDQPNTEASTLSLRHITLGLLWTGDQLDSEASTYSHWHSTLGRRPLDGWSARHRCFYPVKLRHTTLGMTPLDGWSAQHRGLYRLTHHTQETDLHASGGIRTPNPTKRKAADPRFRLRGRRFRQLRKYLFFSNATECLNMPHVWFVMPCSEGRSCRVFTVALTVAVGPLTVCERQIKCCEFGASHSCFTEICSSEMWLHFAFRRFEGLYRLYLQSLGLLNVNVLLFS
jgi:hypothetical protein